MNDFFKPVCLLLWIALAAFVVLLVWAMANHNLPGFSVIFEQPWWGVTIADFYLGVLCVGGLMLAFEKTPLGALLWFLPLCFLGNIIAVIWITVRFPKLIGHGMQN